MSRTPAPPSRRDLAQITAPDLAGHVGFFKFVFNSLMVITFVWLTFTSLSYWDIALGNSILQRRAQNEERRTTLINANSTLSGCMQNQIPGSDHPTGSCLEVYQLSQEQEVSGVELANYSHCRGVKRFLFIRCWTGSNFVGRNSDNIARVSVAAAPEVPGGRTSGADRHSAARHGQAGLGLSTDAALLQLAALAQSETDNPTQAPSGAHDTKATAKQGQAGPSQTPSGSLSASNSSTIAAVLSVFGTYVLPMMFGILGTLVATMRSIHDKIRDSLLSPRDLVLTLTGLPIGAIAGLAVGLFFNSQNGAITALTGLPSGLSLSAAGLAFIAGYGADAFFSFIDSVRQQIFRATNPPPGMDGVVGRGEPAQRLPVPVTTTTLQNRIATEPTTSVGGAN